VAFDLGSYEPVAARLERWLNTPAEQPKRVLTYLVHYTDQRCVFRAELLIGETVIATGWAEETRGEGYVNQTSHFENCETSSVGRALANAGLAGGDHTKRPSREEMQKVARSQPARQHIDDPFPTVVEINGNGRATQKQRDFLSVLYSKKGLTGDDKKQFVVDVLGEPVATGDLSPAQASKLIKALQA
jgi:hypothetical protein